MKDIKSFCNGVKVMKKNHAKVNYGIDFGRFGFWCHYWTPKWHKGRGPYISIGLGLIRIIRGY